MDIITLRHPEDDIEVSIPLEFSREALILGPFTWFKRKQYFLGVIHFIMSVVTFGAYWFWFARYFSHIKVKRLMREGYEPLHKRDMTIADQFGLTEYIEARKVFLSRLGSADDTFNKCDFDQV